MLLIARAAGNVHIETGFTPFPLRFLACVRSFSDCSGVFSLGADYAINSKTEDLCEKIREYTESDGVDVVIECVGKTIATEQAIKIAGRGARVLLFSVPSPDATYPLPLLDVFKKELTIVGSLINPDTHQRAVNLINSGRLEIKKLITHTFPLDKTEDAINKQMSRDSIKVIVHPQK